MKMIFYKIVTTAFLTFAGGFFMYYAWKNKKDKSHFAGNAISAFFLFSSIFLMWWR